VRARSAGWIGTVDPGGHSIEQERMHRVAYRIFMGTLPATLLLLGSPDPVASVQNGEVAVRDAEPERGEPVAPLRGRVTLTDGDVVEGLLTWNRHASTTRDVIEGLRAVSEDGLRFRTRRSERTAPDRRRSVDLPGVRVTWEEDDPELTRRVQGGVRLHWVDRLVRDGDALDIDLRTGDSVELRSAGTDVGPGFRGLEVDLGDGVVRRLEWDEFTRVQLLHDLPLDGRGSHRLHGRVTTDDGASITGWIVWDLDESRAWHRLDGEVEGESIDVEFARIAGIEKADDGEGVVVILRGGGRMSLTGSNDVGPENRGIGVIDEAGELHIVEWDDFRTLDLVPPAGER